jgi:hypothetical protein
MKIQTFMTGCRHIPAAHWVIEKLRIGDRVELCLEPWIPENPDGAALVACYAHNTRIGCVDRHSGKGVEEALRSGLYATATVIAPARCVDDDIVATPRLAVEISEELPDAPPSIIWINEPERDDHADLASVALDQASIAIAQRSPCAASLWLRDAALHVRAMMMQGRDDHHVV